MTDTVAPEPTPEQAALMARVRRMMLIAGLTSALAVAVVLTAVGYRLYRAKATPAAAATDIIATLPKGARIVQRQWPASGGADAGYSRGDRNPHLRCQDAETGRKAQIRQRTLRPARSAQNARAGVEDARQQVYPTVRGPSDQPCPPHISRLFPEANAPFV